MLSMKGKDTLRVYVGDGHQYFSKDSEYALSYLRQVFRKRIKQCENCKEPIEVFPGLVLQDSNGRFWKPKLEVQLIPEERTED